MLELRCRPNRRDGNLIAALFSVDGRVVLWSLELYRVNVHDIAVEILKLLNVLAIDGRRDSRRCLRPLFFD